MTLANLLSLLGTGLGAGFASGLLGVGGSFIMTPVQYMVFTQMGIPADLAVRLAFGTSLAVILPTAASGTWRHHKQGAVRWKTALIMGSCSLACAYGGATLASYLPGAILKIVFGVVVIATGIRMLIPKSAKANETPKTNPWLWAAWGVPIGLISGLSGVGGGILAVPIMVMALKFRMHNAIATSLAVVMITSIGGIIGYITHGQGVPGLPAHCLGYVNLEAWALLAATSIGMAQLGVKTAHRLPGRQLRYIFIGVAFYMGLRMLGAFGIG
ncbi:MAG: sulfite exporter TauE/SafE family protein [Dehalococcoidales bacterium]|nr:sulfite exporter TauE/SafE family protein [Dehalococcoidales bacterium]